MADLYGVWQYDSSEVLAAPAAGYLRSGPAPVSWLALSTQTKGGADVAADLLTLGAGAVIDIQEVSDATLASRFDLTGAPIDHISWVEYPVVPVATTATGPPRKNQDLLVVGRAAVESPHSPYTTVDELARLLTIRAPTPAQGSALQRVLDTAALEIHTECGTVYGSDQPEQVLALLAEVNLERAQEHWQQAEVPYGVVGLGDSVPIMPARDTWDRHAHKLAPLKTTWGLS